MAIPVTTARCLFCNHREHDPGSCLDESACGCEVHTDTALIWAAREDPGLVAQALHRAGINCNPWSGGDDYGLHARLHLGDAEELSRALETSR
jgi:hypothetical protein